jgi:hypothetical protein
MTKLLFEVSPAWILLCVVIATGYALLLYLRAKVPWGQTLHRALAAIRWLLVFWLSLLLLNFMLLHVDNTYEKPVFAVLLDNSASMKAALDSVQQTNLKQNLSHLRQVLEAKNFDVPLVGLRGTELQQVDFSEPVTNLSEALRLLIQRYEHRRLEGVLVVTDGIYNAGLSPTDVDWPVPVYAVGIGDTVQQPDISIRDVWYNKLTYQGSRFPVRAEIIAHGFTGRTIKAALLFKGKTVQEQQQVIPASGFLSLDFMAEAAEPGLHRWDVTVEVQPGERNTLNNRVALFIEVVKGKRNILMLAAAPHPDLRALRAILDKNPNYQTLVHIPGVDEVQADKLNTEAVDLVIFYQLPDARGRLKELTQKYMASALPRFFIIGATTDASWLVQPVLPVRFEAVPRQFDEVTPSLSQQFSLFNLPADAASVLGNMPPVPVHFGKMQVAPQVTAVLFQQVGNVVTDKPLLAYAAQDGRKTGLMMGEGLYRWRMQEFARTGSTEVTDELFGKFIQYLATAEDKRRFRCFTPKTEFNQDEPVVFETEVYNEIFEPVYGNTVDLEIISEQNQRNTYSYVTQPSLSRFSVYSLPEGAYRYTAATQLSGKTEKVSGQFAVTGRQVEMQNLTADFDLLRRLAAQTNGKFFPLAAWNKLEAEAETMKARMVVHTEERYTAALNIPWMLMMLILLVAAEWFLRKYFGGY